MNRVVEVYKHYKLLNGSMLLLFRVRNNYEAYFDDIARGARIYRDCINFDGE